ncbi:site-specific DNA-methyltransferase [Hymenobacter koreensis]|uniref:site-specific DNA-methyltransferase (adenine-specific) n=1 Tax=Hymenobacter koreensis TaxID=1084523 RepID=A0ABP8JIF7_9BACT
MQNLQHDLIELLREHRPDFFANNRLNTDQVAEAAYRYDAGLLALLLGHAGLRGQFFQTVGEAEVFKLGEFENFLHNRTLLPQSYTAYRDRIGLRVARGRYLRESNDVVLAWPYKDCVLEGGQDKDDQKRDEVFYNETLAPDEITRLLAPKALTNFTRYDADGAHPLPADAAPDPTTENLVIKGNNLLALHSLLPRFRGQVKLIYIDPPYNTETDSFQYNDKFTHSTWLTFMRNRLEVAKALLHRSGSIFIQLDDNEAGYCKVLCDEIFGRPNFVANAIWEKADSPRMDAEYFSSRHDNTLIYARDIEQFELNQLRLEGEHPEHYDRTDAEGKRYYTKPLRAMGIADTRAARPTMYYALEAPDGTKVLPKKQDGVDGRWRWKKEKAATDKNRIEWVNGRNGWTPYYRIYASENSTRPPETIWTHTEVGSNRTAKAEIKAVLPEVEAFATPKPERLIQRILEIGTKPGDLVLDFFVGSGTTAAVAHKMGRRYIAIEQMDYINTVTVPRLQKVIAGEQGGVSKAQNWTGGGFIVRRTKGGQRQLCGPRRGRPGHCCLAGPVRRDGTARVFAH